MPRFRQRVPEVSAIQYDGTPENETAIFDLAEIPREAQERRRTIRATFGNVMLGDWFVSDGTGRGVSIMHDAEFRIRYEVENPLSPLGPRR